MPVLKAASLTAAISPVFRVVRTKKSAVIARKNSIKIPPFLLGIQFVVV